ncbi:MAG: SUF system Fe-S cluster assembly regulator [Proteobacteria bacterium]|nr:SUF system Fe-S cluster assembly regulator [Pseudomonadota bacterium]
MLRISRLTDYATATVLYLHTVAGMHSTDSIAPAIGVELPTASKVLKLLTKASILTSIRGVNGGYHLTKNIEDLSLFDVITAIEGDTAITECTKTDSLCAQEPDCDTRSGWQQVNDEIKQILIKMTIKRMAELNGVAKPDIALMVKDYVRTSTSN